MNETENSDGLENMPADFDEAQANDMIMRPFRDGQWNEKLPEELEQFFISHDIPLKFSVMLHKFRTTQAIGRTTLLATFKNEVPAEEHVAQLWGLGAYRMLFSYRKPNAPKKEYTMKPYDFVLAGEHFERIHEEYQEAEREARLLELQKRSEEKAIKDRYLFGTGDGSGLNSVSKSIEALAPILQLAKPDTSLTTELLKTMVAAQGNRNDSGGDTMKMMMLMMQQGAEANRQQTQLFVSMMQSQTNQFLGLLPMLMGGKEDGEGKFEKILALTERIQGMTNPPVKTFGDRIFDLLEEWAPAVLKIIETPPAQRGLMDKMLIEKVKKSQDVARLRGERDQLVTVVNKMDEKYGPAIADQILTGLDFQRPEETAGNYEKYKDVQPPEPGPGPEEDTTGEAPAT